MNYIIEGYDDIITKAKDIFTKECIKDGTVSWRILRPVSIVDKIYIIATGIQTQIQISVENDKSSTFDLEAEFISLLNTSAVARIQFTRGLTTIADIMPERAIVLYKQAIELAQRQTKRLVRSFDSFEGISHKYLLEMIINKIKEIKELLKDKNTGIYYSIEKLMDIINLSIFALIIK